MENSSNISRFLMAALLSMAVLFGWSYFFSPKPAEDNANANVAANTNTATANTNVAQSQPTPTPATEPKAEETPAEVVENAAPARQITIKTSLYEVTLDSKGAVATSWILKKNLSPKGSYDLWADNSDGDAQKPLQLISKQALASDPQQVPFRLFTADEALNKTVNGAGYTVSIPEDTIELAVGQQQQIDFTYTGKNGVEVKKSFLFRGDSYLSDLSISLTQNGQPVPNTKLLIGASIGDHEINHHGFYQIESEGVSGVEGDIRRHPGASFTFDAANNAALTDPGTVNWAGVGDAYFAMAAIPASPGQGLEFKASKYEVDTRPYYPSIFKWVTRAEATTETRHLVTAYVPIAADGSTNKIYTGTKDYFVLHDISEPLTKDIGRDVNLVDLINFSNYWPIRWFVKPISIPIVYALHYINGVTHNYGLAIILFTIFFYSLLFPLRWSQSKSFKKAGANAPKMKELQDKLKDMQKKGIPNDDPRMRELQMQQLKMTKDALPIGGCLPMILQFPLLISFYTAVTVSLEVRQASFMWLPDLSAADPWHLLEFGFALSMILAMKFTPTSAAVTPEQQMQQKLMTYLMPVMMLWVMWSAPSGLLLYWFTGNIVSFGQQMLINKMNKPAEPPEGQIVIGNVPKGAKKVKQKPKLAT